MNAAVRVRRCGPPVLTPETVAVVPDMLLPLVSWRDVPVLREIRQELTRLERFVLEMALTLGEITVEDFTEVVTLPRQVLTAGATRLAVSGALHLVDGSYEVDPDLAARTLQEAGIRRQLPATADFVLLPRTGDLLEVQGKKKSWLRQLELARLVPASRAPVPNELWNERRSSYLAGRVQKRTVALLDAGIVGVPVPDDDPPLVAGGAAEANARVRLCPAYRCSAEVTRDRHGHHVVHAVLQGSAGGRRGKQDDGRPAATVEVRVDLTGADQLIARWLDLMARMENRETQQAAWQEIGPSSAGSDEGRPAAVHRRGPMEWEFSLTGRSAQAIAQERRTLARPAGVRLENADGAVDLLCSFVPADDEARALFSRDEAVSQLLAADDPVRELPQACRAAAAAFGVTDDRLTPQEIRERAWDLGGYRLAYALRESEDFPYE